MLTGIHEQLAGSLTECLDHVYCIACSDCFAELIQVANRSGDGVGTNLTRCDGIETIKQVCTCSAAVVTFSIPDVRLQVATEFSCQIREHSQGDIHVFQILTFGDGAVVDRLYKAVRRELLHHATQEGVERASLDVHAIVVDAGLAVGAQVDVAGELAHSLRIADTTAHGHVLHGLLHGVHRHLKQFFAEFVAAQSKSFRSDCHLSHIKSVL